MALIGNGMRAGGNPCAFRFGTAYGINRASYHSTGQMRNFHFGEMTFDKTTGESQSNRFGKPPGRLQPTSWNLPIKGGAFASQLSTVTVSSSATGSQGLSPSSVSSSITLSGAALGQLISAGIAAGTITVSGTATPAALLSAIASGTVTLTGTSVSEGTGTFTGSGSISLTGTINSQGYGNIVATTAESGLTTLGIANAVWAAVAANNNTAGSMGEKVNNAGAAGNPWAEVMDGGLTAGEIYKIIAAILAGKVSGAGTGTITFRNISDDKDVVVATVSQGNRSDVVLDP